MFTLVRLLPLFVWLCMPCPPPETGQKAEPCRPRCERVVEGYREVVSVRGGR